MLELRDIYQYACADSVVDLHSEWIRISYVCVSVRFQVFGFLFMSPRFRAYGWSGVDVSVFLRAYGSSRAAVFGYVSAVWGASGAAVPRPPGWC